MTSFFPGVPVTCYDSVAEAWREVAATPEDVPVLMTGSLFLAGEMLARRQNMTEEYQLNERLEAPVAKL
jgi:hypothetical protein